MTAAGDVRIAVPATVANLGPGFDCLGLALEWRNDYSFSTLDEGRIEVSAEGEGADDLPTGEDNLAVRAARSILGHEAGIRVHCRVGVPVGRGLGSSATAVVAGLAAALAVRGTDSEPLLERAVAMEGHADNVAPCLFGGVVVSAGTAWVRLEPPEDLRVLVCVAPQAQSTEAARRALPEAVPLRVAAANAGRAALLAASFATGRLDTLLAATHDELHQPARFRMMPESGRLVTQLRNAGFAAFLAGAGPSVAALVPVASAEAAGATGRVLAGPGWDVRMCEIARHGPRWTTTDGTTQAATGEELAQDG